MTDMQESGYHLRHAGAWRPVLLRIATQGACDAIVRLDPERTHTLGRFRGVSDAYAALEEGHRSNPRRIKAARA